MADLGELKIPVAMRAAAETIISLTDGVCADLLDQGVIPYIPVLGRDGTAEWLKRGGGT